MIGFYAMGGGMGHLTRIKTFIQNQRFSDPIKVITAHPRANSFFPQEQLVYVQADASTTRQQLFNTLHQSCKHFHFDHLYIDTFPCGILGELDTNTILHEKAYYLARRLQWEIYQKQISTPLHFETTYQLEQLCPPHQQFINSHSRQIEMLPLKYPQPQPVRHPLLLQRKPIWLIVHTSHEEELQLLIDHALDIAQIEKCEAQLVVLSELDVNLPPQICLLSNEQPTDWYPLAEKIFTAAGFNTWHQLSDYRKKHICLPFKRKFDDQFWRSSSSDS